MKNSFDLCLSVVDAGKKKLGTKKWLESIDTERLEKYLGMRDKENNEYKQIQEAALILFMMSAHEMGADSVHENYLIEADLFDDLKHLILLELNRRLKIYDYDCIYDTNWFFNDGIIIKSLIFQKLIRNKGDWKEE
jgi:hypothetical protein